MTDRDKRQFFEEDFEALDALTKEPDQRVARAIVASADRNYDLGLIEGIKIGRNNAAADTASTFMGGVVTALAFVCVANLVQLLWT